MHVKVRTPALEQVAAEVIIPLFQVCIPVAEIDSVLVFPQTVHVKERTPALEQVAAVVIFPVFHV